MHLLEFRCIGTSSFLNLSRLRPLVTFCRKEKHDTVDNMQLLATLAGLTALASISNGQITKVNDFPGTPTKLGMYVKVPTNLKTPAPIIVGVHHCQGSAQGYSTETKFVQLADQHNFIVILPNSRSSGGCFDVASTASMFEQAPL